MQDDSLRNRDDDDQRSDSLNGSAAEPSQPPGEPPITGRLAEFERLYREQFGAVVAYFARRNLDAQLVADLTTDTFVAAVQGFARLELSRTSERAWIIGIARKVHARHRESDPREQQQPRLGGQGLLDRGETKELMWWIDVERASRDLIGRLERLAVMDREAVELVDICGLSPAEAARELGISSGALRVRLIRTRARLRREGVGDA
jgi:DNA-directed RNA polymerase specialized sigma24 family protein